MRRLSVVLATLLLVPLFLLAGCSGEPVDPQDANNGNAPAKLETNKAPADNAPLPGEGSENAAWLAPYLTAEVRSVTMVDVRKLGPLWPVASGFLTLAANGQLPDLSQVEAVAVLNSEPTPDGPGIPVGGLLRLKSPPSPEFIQEIKMKLRGMMGMPESDEEFAQAMAQLGPQLAAQMTPRVEADGRTLIIGLGKSLDQLKARPAANPAMAAALQALGDHAYVMYGNVGDAERAEFEVQLESAKEDPERSPVAEMVINFTELAVAARTVSLAADVTPRLHLHATIVPNDPAQLPTLQSKTQTMLDQLKSAMQTDSARQPSQPTASEVGVKTIVNLLEQGKLTTDGGVLRFNYESTPEVSTEFLTSIPAALAEMMQASQHAGQVVSRASKLKEVGNGLLLHADRYNERLPCNIMSADGKPLMSWRVALLPVVGYDEIYEQLKLDEPWDSAHNAPLLKQVDQRYFAGNPNTPDGHADLLAVIGDKFGFSPQESTAKGHGTVTIGSVTDGMSYTAFVVEVDPARSVPWAKPEDYIWNPAKPTEGLGSPDEPFFQAVYGDTRVMRISKNESADTLRAMFGRSEGQTWDLKRDPKAP